MWQIKSCNLADQVQATGQTPAEIVCIRQISKSGFVKGNLSNTQYAGEKFAEREMPIRQGAQTRLLRKVEVKVLKNTGILPPRVDMARASILQYQIILGCHCYRHVLCWQQ